MYFFTVSIAHANRDVTYRRVAADDLAAARKLAWQIADELGDVTSVEVWRA